MASTTIDIDTKLSAVNSILGAIGQSPITTLDEISAGVQAFDNPEVAFIFNLLRDANVDTQAEGWHFNKEEHITFQPDSVTKHITIADNVLQLDLHGDHTRRTKDLVRRNGRLYDKIEHTDEFDSDLDLDVVYLVEFENLPIVFRRYITYRASRQAATQLVANPNLVKLLAQQEALARASLMEYECNQADHSMFGFQESTSYQTYQPFQTLRRR